MAGYYYARSHDSTFDRNETRYTSRRDAMRVASTYPLGFVDTRPPSADIPAGKTDPGFESGVGPNA